MKKHDAFMISLGATIVIAFFGLIYLLIKIAVPADNKDILNIVVGSLIGAFSMVVSYYFGSSMGSKSKDEKLNKE